MSTVVPTEKNSSAVKNSKTQPNILGPVSNLEEHVHPEWWRRIFNALYLKTDADVVEDQAITGHEIDLFTQILNPTPQDNILDLCCGQGRHTLELARRGFSVEGFDRSRYLIQRAKSVAKKENLAIRFKEGDARKLPYPADSFETVMILGNSFGYFESDQDDLTILQGVAKILKPQGKLLIDVTDGDYIKRHYQARTWEWINKKMFVCRERSLSADGRRLISREVITDVTKGVVADQFYAERLYNEDDLTTMLQKAGFSNVTVHGNISANSQRNQDLGMMEKRIIITGQINKNWTPLKKRAKNTLKNVTVLLGDPSQYDIIKPDGIFDSDDVNTINQLKNALASLKEYRFNFVDNHANLIQTLRQLQGKTDYILNLCDEGFNNDPRKELHVPALLEILNLPYTGSNPQCLAYCYDKSLVRGIAKEMNIPVPQAFFIKPEDTAFELPFNFPVIVKPNFGDSSFGITQNSVAHTFEELINAIAAIREQSGYDKPMLVEEFLTGKDMSVGVIGNPPAGYTVLPVIEEDYSSLPPHLPKICGYEAKWNPDSPYWNLKSIPAGLPEATEKFLVECCLKLFERLECRDYARFDWRLDANGNPKLLEVNPNPGWCWDGHLAKMAALVDMTYPDMLKAILQAAEQRIDLHRSVSMGKTVPVSAPVFSN